MSIYGLSTAILAVAFVGARLGRGRALNRPVPRSRFVLPLAIGTYVAFLGATYWDYIIKVAGEAPSAEYFSQISQVIPLLLIALGFEAKQFQAHARSSIGLAATIVTVILVAIGEMAALTILPLARPANILEDWQAYAAFVVTLQACSVGLVMLVWAIIVSSTRSRDEAQDVA